MGDKIILPESAKLYEMRVPYLNYHIGRMRRRARYQRGEDGDILITTFVILEDAAKAMEWARDEINRLLAGGSLGPE